VETFRCPTCLGVLHDAQVQRCAACGQNLRRKKPKILGDEHRIGAVNLPIDRWMLARLNESDVMIVSPVTDQGAPSTTPVAAPEVAPPPEPAPPVEHEPEMTAVVVESVDAVPLTDERLEIPGDDEGLLEPTVGALSLDQYTGGAKASVEAAPEPEPEPDPAATAAPVTELDPDVRALVDELYEQARAELSGTELASFESTDPDKRVND
jgi:hypothetical protein